MSVKPIALVLLFVFAHETPGWAQVNASPLVSGADASNLLGSGGVDGTLRLTLEEAIARGTKESHRLKELTAREDSAVAAASGQRAANRPQVSLLGGYQRISHIDEYAIVLPTGQRQVLFPDIPDKWRGRIDLQWPIYSSGRVNALVRAAEAERDATAFERDAAVADLRLEVTRAYWALLTARETVGVVRISLDRLGEQRDVARAQQSAGFVPPSDVLRVEAQRSRQRVLLIEAENAAAVVEADLRRLIGLDASIGIEIADRLDVLPQEVPEAEGLLVEAQDKRPERRAIEVRIAGQGARVSAADALRRPVLSIAGGYDVARPNPRVLPPRARTDDSWDVSLNASWLLWDGGRARAAQQEASASERAARERLAEFDSILSLEILQRRLDLSSALAAVAAAGDEVGSAAEARRVIDERYRAGVATSVELLNAQVALLEAELNRTRTLANVRLAQARLDRVVGR